MNLKAAKKIRRITKSVMKRDFEKMVEEAMKMSFRLRFKLAMMILKGR